ncbi:MAG: hypothetical protein ABIR46_04790 [Candidatus Saccharimonadales bacterium]
MSLPFVVVLAVLLFGLAYVTKRRFGVLGLGLVAGLVLSREIAKETADVLKYLDFPIGSLTFPIAASVLLILVPALLMLISGPKYSDKRLAIGGSIVFALFAVILLLGPISVSLVMSDRSLQPLLTTIAQNSPILISIGVVLAVVDTMYAQGKKPVGKKGKH